MSNPLVTERFKQIRPVLYCSGPYQEMNRRSIVQTCLVEVGSASCSGIVIDTKSGFVITHGTVLLPYLSNRFTTFKRLIKEGHLKNDVFEDLTVQVTVEEAFGRNKQSQSLMPVGSKTSGYTVEPINLIVSGSDPTLPINRFVKLEGQLKMVWRSHRFSETLRKLLPISEWKFSDDTQEDEKKEKAISKDQVYHLLPYFVLIKVPLIRSSIMATDHRFDYLSVGANVFVVSTPFGNLSPEVFMNSVSSGIVSNLAGERETLILTDARCIPGSEGGAIYRGSPFESRPLGMVVAPLCWKANEWIGLAVGCQLSEIMSSLRKVFQESTFEDERSSGSLVATSIAHGPLVDNVPVVFVSSGCTWGSGVLIHQGLGIVLTCSHVVNGAKEVKVRVDVPQFSWHVGDVVYATSEDQVFDVALVRLRGYKHRPQWPKTISIETDLNEGAEAFVVGHAAFGQEHRLKPTITRGVISKVIYHSNMPIIIQTSCSVNSGASGGALINKNGQLLGVVVCNARDKDCGATYPHLNLSIPAVTVWSTISRYLESGKTSVLTELTLAERSVQLLWKLQGSEVKSMQRIKSQL